MSVWSGRYLGLALLVALAGACGSTPAKQDESDDSATADDDSSDDSSSGDDDDSSGGGTKPSVDAGKSTTTPKDAGHPAAGPDAGKTGGTTADAGAGGGSDAGKKDSGTTVSPDGGMTSGHDAGGSSTTGGKPGACCSDGDCLCHGDVPASLGAAPGPFQVQSYDINSGTVYYPSNADAPFAAVAILPGFLNSGPEMTDWGTFYASWGIVCAVTNTSPIDLPLDRAGLLLNAIMELKGEATKSGGPLNGKLSGRYGTSGYSMGGGGTTIAAGTDSSLKSSIGLAAWGGDGTGTQVPTLLFCGDVDIVAPCDMSDGVYAGIPDSTPKMEIVVPLADHFSWFGPADGGGGMSGGYALAFEKVYLEGDTRWKTLLLTPPAGGTQTTNIH